MKLSVNHLLGIKYTIVILTLLKQPIIILKSHQSSYQESFFLNITIANIFENSTRTKLSLVAKIVSRCHQFLGNQSSVKKGNSY
jgi:aspartate carbamoyltransferase catalytic subunit